MSQLPYRENASIYWEKIDNYLLSETHSVGKAKAKFFRLLGYNEDTRDELIDGLLNIAYKEEVIEKTSSPYGIKYAIDGTLHTPNGRRVHVRTVWIIETERYIPQFVTAYPY